MCYRIAVQLYGHLRTFEQCAQSLKKHLLDKYDCDVFIHTWSMTNHVDSSWYPEEARSKSVRLDDSVLTLLNNLYSPKDCLIEEQNLFNDEGEFGTHDTIRISLKGMRYMTYSQYMASQLREKYAAKYHINYDYVVAIRPDILLMEDLDIDIFRAEFNFFKDVSIHFLRTTEIHLRGRKFYNYPLAGDCFYFAQPHTMSIICGVFKHFDRYYKDITTTFPQGVENPEVGFFENIYQHGIISRQYQFYYAIKRADSRYDIALYPPNEKPTPAPKSFTTRIVRLCIQKIVRQRIPILYPITKKLNFLFKKIHEEICEAEK